MFLRWKGAPNGRPESVWAGEGNNYRLAFDGTVVGNVPRHDAEDLLSTGDFEEATLANSKQPAPQALTGSGSQERSARSLDDQLSLILQDPAQARFTFLRALASLPPVDAFSDALDFCVGVAQLGGDELLLRLKDAVRRIGEILSPAETIGSVPGFRDSDDPSPPADSDPVDGEGLFLAPADEMVEDDGRPGEPPTYDEPELAPPAEDGQLSLDALKALGHEMLAQYPSRGKLAEIARDKGVRYTKQDGREDIVGLVLGLPAGWQHN